MILDFGSQYTKLIARRIREFNVYSEVFPYYTKFKKIKKFSPKAIILSGGPASVYDKDSPKIDKKIFSLGVPILGICYGLQLIAYLMGGKIQETEKREYGPAKIRINKKTKLLEGVKEGSQVWMSHGDEVVELPEGFYISASTDNTKIAVAENDKLKIYAVQFHPEVVHTEYGKNLLSNFILKIAKVKQEWTMESFIQSSIKKIRETVKNSNVILGLSGGVDSTVAGVLIHNAIGEQLIPVFVDTGFMRKNEANELREQLKKLGIKVYFLDAKKIFYKKLKGISSPEEKRRIIGETFIEVFQEKAKEFNNIKFLAQGTTYPDVIESAKASKVSAKIKSHHNLIVDNLKLKLLEPLRELFKDEVREVGKLLGLDREFIIRHPFPGPGLAVRIIGKTSALKVKILQEADYILNEEVKNFGYYEKLWQSFAVLLPIKSVGVMGDKRTYEYVCAIRLVTSTDGMTADCFFPSERFLKKVSSRIVNEVKGINRVVFDITSKPPATIEWE